MSITLVILVSWVVAAVLVGALLGRRNKLRAAGIAGAALGIGGEIARSVVFLTAAFGQPAGTIFGVVGGFVVGAGFGASIGLGTAYLSHRIASTRAGE